MMVVTAPLGILLVLAVACDGGREEYQPEDDAQEQYVSAVAPGTEVIELAMGDFCFYPDPLHLSAGETVTLKVTNLGNLRHELMGGRELGGHGYEQDFFAGLPDLRVTGDPRGYTWAVESEDEDAHGGDGAPAEEGGEAEGGHGHGDAPGTDWSPDGEAWNCGEQVMSHANGTDYDMYAHHEVTDEVSGGAVEDMDQHMEGEAGGEHAEGDEGGHGGEVYELTLDAFAAAYMTFTVPEDYVGEWDIGCFIPRHYERGMGGRIVVE